MGIDRLDRGNVGGRGIADRDHGGIIAGLLAAFALALAAPALAKKPDLGEAERLIARGTNEFRAEQGLARLEPNAPLAEAAQAFADYMARTDRYGHAADGRQPSDRAEARGYRYCSVAENIAYQYSSESFATEELARRFLEGWKNSPGHRRNMLDPHGVHMANAVAHSTRTGRFYGVQMFGQPRESSMEFGIANRAKSQVRYRVDGESFTLPPGRERVHTVCVPPEVTFTNAEGGALKPQPGERLRVEGDRRLVVRRDR
jgi:uncharacterized protein YkwD